MDVAMGDITLKSKHEWFMSTYIKKFVSYMYYVEVYLDIGRNDYRSILTPVLGS